MRSNVKLDINKEYRLHMYTFGSNLLEATLIWVLRNKCASIPVRIYTTKAQLNKRLTLHTFCRI